jgi:predicted deacylase
MRRLPGASFLLCLLAAVLVVPAQATAGEPESAAVSHVAARRTSAILETRVIGYSVQGRPIRAWHLGNPASSVKAVFIAAMHGNEPKPSAILRDLRDGRRIKGADIWVVPTMNPDGRILDTRKNADGVDLNRNFPVHWIAQTGPYDSGPAPASEPETQAMMAFLTEIRPRFVVSFHQPLHGVDMTNGRKAHRLALRLHRYLDLPKKRFNCNSGCHGTMTQWFNRTFPGAAVTVEYGRHMTWRQKHCTGPRGLLRAVHAWR